MEPFIGEIIMFGGNFAPRGWAFCSGQLLAISQNTALFSILGTTYGGDGRTTFALPDLRGRAAIHAGRGPGLTQRSLGARGGSETNMLNSTQLPSHTHVATGALKVGAAASTDNPAGNYPGVASGRVTSGAGGGVQVNASAATATGTGAADGVNVTVGNTGGGQSVNNMQPWECVNFIIATVGIYPSRN